MRNPYTTIAGAISAAAGSLAAVPNLPTWIHVAAVAVGAIALGVFGFFAKDADPLPKIPVGPCVALAALAGTLTVAGCTLAHFRTRVSSPTFGSVELDIGGGTIGQASTLQTTSTNGRLMTLSSSATIATPSTNRPSPATQTP
jgi:hypothetical protein